MNEPYSEHFTIGDSRMMVFAMQHEDGKNAWIMSSTDHSVEIQISGHGEKAVAELKRMRKAIDGAVKFFNDKQKQNNVGKGKKNDESKK
jgi:hypothetical protein